jgi:LDH2 family malate/lactate/ureidoglycolate dehydrogenase
VASQAAEALPTGHAPLGRWEQLATDLLMAAGMAPAPAATTAQLLVRSDAMGRRTHGLAMLPLYLGEIEQGRMARAGEPEVVSARGVVAVWDAGYQSGQWAVARAIDWAAPKAREQGIAAVAIRRSHHIGCLAALCLRAVEQGLVAWIANSDPAGKRVAPFGGTQALFTPDPFAFGYPARPNPVLVDICASITTTSMTRQKVAEGRAFDQPWLLDHRGQPTTDPRVLEHSTPRGSLQLIGGQDHGHKGFGLALMVETLSQALSGHGRADAPNRWGGSTYLQLFDPALFAGEEAFARQADFLAAQCRDNPPADPAHPVRLPGDSAMQHLRQAQQQGLDCAPAVLAALTPWAQRLGVATNLLG